MAEYFLNDQLKQSAEATSVDELVRSEYPSSDGIAVAIDGEVIPRSRWAETEIPEQAKVLIVTAAQGG